MHFQCQHPLNTKMLFPGAGVAAVTQTAEDGNHPNPGGGGAEEIGDNSGVSEGGADNEIDHGDTEGNNTSRPGGHKQKHRSKGGYLPLPGGGTYDRVQKGGRNTLVSHSSHRTPSRQHNQNGQQKKKKSRGNQQRDGGGNRNNKFRRPKTLEGVSLNKAKKTDNEELPFYSLPDSIFDELPEYFRPEPRGLAALISFSRENTVKKLK